MARHLFANVVLAIGAGLSAWLAVSAILSVFNPGPVPEGLGAVSAGGLIFFPIMFIALAIATHIALSLAARRRVIRVRLAWPHALAAMALLGTVIGSAAWAYQVWTESITPAPGTSEVTDAQITAHNAAAWRAIHVPGATQSVVIAAQVLLLSWLVSTFIRRSGSTQVVSGAGR